MFNNYCYLLYLIIIVAHSILSSYGCLTHLKFKRSSFTINLHLRTQALPFYFLDIFL